jgi:hypothetical protein
MTDNHAAPMPFGKYRGYCSHCVAVHDVPYVAWCNAQPWFRESHPGISAQWSHVPPLVMCNVPTQTGDACTFWAEFGSGTCRQHSKLDDEFRCTADNANGSGRCGRKAGDSGMCRQHFDRELDKVLSGV